MSLDFIVGILNCKQKDWQSPGHVGELTENSDNILPKGKPIEDLIYYEKSKKWLNTYKYSIMLSAQQCDQNYGFDGKINLQIYLREELIG